MSSVNYLSDHQFGGARKSQKSSRNDSDRVYGQLSKDYPKDKIDWVHRVRWTGPVNVPLKRVEFDEERMWKASHERERVEHFRDMIDSGQDMKPVVMMDRPGKKIMVADGHHRAEAYQEENKPVLAWVGHATTVEGPWDSLHDFQFRDTRKDRSLYR